jgi:uncharacterized SAM-binding protein YcdF (DUF218 family)
VTDLLWWALQPSSLLLALLLLGWLAALFGRTGVARRTIALTLLAWLAALFLPLDYWLAVPLERTVEAPEALPAQVDGIIVLGGAVDWPSSRAADQLVLGRSAERVIAGDALARRYPAARLVLTGVPRDVYNNDLRQAPNDRSFFFGPAYEGRNVTFLEASRSTYDDARLALEAVRPGAGETWLLVTSAWHMPRAHATFETLGWSPAPYPVDPSAAAPRWGWPNIPAAAERMARVDLLVREWGAVLVYQRLGRIDRAAWQTPPGAALP